MTSGRALHLARVVGVAGYLPPLRMSSAEVEERIRGSGTGFAPRRGIVEAITGIRYRHVAAGDVQASDLAAAAAAKLLADVGVQIGDVDLVIFGSASQDMVEPATAHILAAKLGARCPVFDVKNACNSFLNAIQTAEALIATGRYDRVLIASGETPSRATRWQVADFAQFAETFPGYTLSDSGAAMLLERAEQGGIFHRSFVADSSQWDVGTLPGGGSAHPRDPDYTYFRMDGRRLKDAFRSLGRAPLDAALAEHRLTWHDFSVICVHQVTMPYLRTFIADSGVPEQRLVITLPEHGNLASATLPFQLATAWQQGRVGPRDRVALIGLAGGVSLGVIFLEL